MFRKKTKCLLVNKIACCISAIIIFSYSLILNNLFNPLLCSRKMVRYTLKILQQMLKDFQSVSDHFMTLQSKWLMNEW